MSTGESVSSGEFDSEEFERCIVSDVYMYRSTRILKNLFPGSVRCQERGESEYALHATREETTTHRTNTRET